MRITNLVFWVQENKLSEKFYRKLGFDIAQSDDEHTLVSLGGFTIDLVNMRDDEKFVRDAMSPDKGRGVYINIHVDDVDAKHRELSQAGITPATEPRDWDWGNREFIVKDPDGYKLCFWHKVAN